jgi:hypothetical protein
MKSVRFSVAKLMVAIGIIALDLAAGRFLLDYDAVLLVGVLPAGLALQLGLFRLIRSRGRLRAFWAGFVIAGALAALSFAWGIIFAGSIGIRYDWTTGKIETVSTPGSLGGDRVQALWSAYGAFAERCLERLPYASDLVGRDWPDPASQLLVALVDFLPQLFMALAGGLLALWVVWLAGLCHRHPSSIDIDLKVLRRVCATHRPGRNPGVLHTPYERRPSSSTHFPP